MVTHRYRSYRCEVRTAIRCKDSSSSTQARWRRLRRSRKTRRARGQGPQIHTEAALYSLSPKQGTCLLCKLLYRASTAAAGGVGAEQGAAAAYTFRKPISYTAAAYARQSGALPVCAGAGPERDDSAGRRKSESELQARPCRSACGPPVLCDRLDIRLYATRYKAI